MTSSERRGLALGTLVLAGLGAFVALRMEVVTDITHFLPGGEDRSRWELSRRIASSELARTMVLLVEAPDVATARTASRDLEEALRDEPRVARHLAFLETGPPEGVHRAMWELYKPRRLAFLADSPETARERLSDEGLREAARSLKRRLETPMSPMVTRIARDDPFLVLPDLVERVRAWGRVGGVEVADGRFVSRSDDGPAAVLFLGTDVSAFDTRAQAPLLAGIREAFDTVDASTDGELTLRQSGANRFAVHAERTIRSDITRVSLVSVAGLVLLFGLLFRSIRLVALVGLPIGAGMLAGCATNLLLFGRIHGLTLAFGASLIGVAIDYAVHFYNHHTLAPDPGGPSATLRRIRVALVLGAATTVAGFIGLAWSAFPGLRQVALFGASGVTAALAATIWILPPLVPRTPRPVALQQRLASGLGRLLAAMRRRRRMLWLLPAAAVAVTAAGAPRVVWNDDPRALSPLDPELLAEDRAVRERVGRFAHQRFVVAVGEDAEAALRANDRAADRLRAAREAGEIGAFRSVHALLPSAARQRAVADAVRDVPDLWPRFAEAFEAVGFEPEAFEGFRDRLRGDPAEPLRWADLAESPLKPLVRSFRVSIDDRVAFVSFLHDVRRPEALGERLAGVEGATWIDQGAMMREAYRSTRQSTLRMLLLGLVAVLAMVAARYRDLRRTLAAFVPALLAAGVTVGVLALSGRELNLLVLTSLLMVLSMGVDYGVFLAEAATHDRGAGAAAGGDEVTPTVLSLVAAALSTVLGFGLLAMSDHPALESIGLTAGVGVLSSLALAPATLVLLGTTEEGP